MSLSPPYYLSMEPSPLDEALRRVGDRWSLRLVEALLEGPRRFTDLTDEIEGIAPNTLSDRLKHLESEAVVTSKPYSERPPRFTYELTAEGRQLAGALRSLTQWGAQRLGDSPAHHAACGSEMEVRWYCPTCARSVEESEIDEVQHL